MTVGDGVGMTVEERGVRNMVVDACEGVGIYRDVLEVKLCDGPKPEDPKPYHLGHYLGLARDGADKVVACVDRGLLARSPEFRRSCVSGALLDFLEEADRGSFRQDEWSTAAEAREVLAAGGAGAREGLAGGETFRLVYPRGSVVTLCPACGRAGVYTDAELAFGCCDNLRARCDACGAERHVAMVSCDVLLAAGGLPAGAPRADEPRVGGLYLEADGSCVRLDAESLARFRVLDLGALMEAGAISDVRGIGLASFLECGRMGFAEAWGYLARHPAFVGHFPECFSFAPTAVCPETLCVEDDAALNTRTRVRVRGGAWAEFAGAIVDDISLVTSGWTFEEAVCNLAEAVRRTYGDDFAPFCVDAG